MGYRVGNRCFFTEQEATDYKMSMVVPTITSDGSLKTPVRKADGWYYGTTATVTKPRPYPYTGNYTEKITKDQKIILTHPLCDPQESLKDGLTIGVAISLLFFMAFIFKLAIKLFQSVEGKDHE